MIYIDKGKTKLVGTSDVLFVEASTAAFQIVKATREAAPDGVADNLISEFRELLLAGMTGDEDCFYKKCSELLHVTIEDGEDEDGEDTDTTEEP